MSLVDRVRHRLAEDAAVPTAHTVAAALRAENQLFGNGTVLDLVDQLRRDTTGAGPLESLLMTPGVTDVLVNGPTEVYVDSGQGLQPAPVAFADDEEVRRLAQRLAAQGGRRLDDASPFVDVRLADGTRFHAVLAPIARPGTLLSLRIPARQTFDLDELADSGLLTPLGTDCLEHLISSRAAFVISGGTGSGKTTLMAALLSLVAPTERLVIVEDATELRPHHPHVVGLEARPANIEGAGAIGLRDLVRQALRMRPDRLIVGEVRGAEALRFRVPRAGFARSRVSEQVIPARDDALNPQGRFDRAVQQRHLHLQNAQNLALLVERHCGEAVARPLCEFDQCHHPILFGPSVGLVRLHLRSETDQRVQFALQLLDRLGQQFGRKTGLERVPNPVDLRALQVCDAAGHFPHRGSLVLDRVPAQPEELGGEVA